MYDQLISSNNKANKEAVGFKRRKQVEEMLKQLEKLCEKRREARRAVIQQPKSGKLKEEYKMLNTKVKKGVKDVKDTLALEVLNIGKTILKNTLTLNFHVIMQQ